MTTASEPRWRSLHPASVLVNLLPRTWRVLRGAWPLLLALLWRGDQSGLFDLFILGFFFVSTIGATIAHFLTLRYRVVDGRLEITTGLLQRQARVIDVARIQNVEIVRNLFQSAFGLAEVRIDTASGGDVEGLLSALSDADARELLASLGRDASPQDRVAAEVLVENDWTQVLWYGASGVRFGAGAALAIGLVFEGFGALDPERLVRLQAGIGALGVAAAIGAVLTGSFAFGTATSLLRFWGFSLERVDGRLSASSGLFTRRRVEIRPSKVQRLTVRESLVRRWLGFAVVHVETAAARRDGGGTASAEAVVPFVAPADVAALTSSMTGLDPTFWDTPLWPAHPRARRRALTRGAIRGALLAGLVAWAGWPWTFALAPVVGIGSVVVAALDHRNQGWLVDDAVIVARRGYLDRRTDVLPRNKVQCVERIEGPVLRRLGLAVLAVEVAGGRVALPVMADAEARRWFDALSAVGRAAT